MSTSHFDITWYLTVDTHFAMLTIFSERYAERVQHNTDRKDFLSQNPKVHDELSSKNVFRDDGDDDDADEEE
jgi:hypothetical protein